MTILTDLDAAIDPHFAKIGHRDIEHGLTLRMGPGARAALVACKVEGLNLYVRNGEPVEYRTIPIVPVEAPAGQPVVALGDRFHGWELAA